MKAVDPEKIAFVQGFAAALGTLCRECDLPTTAVNIARSNGFGLEDFRKAHVDGFDLRPIRKAFRETK